MTATHNTHSHIDNLRALNFSYAVQIADITSALDYMKNAADPVKAKTAQTYLDALHDIAHRLAGDRAHKLYAPEDEATDLQIALSAGSCCCGGEVNAWPGWAAVEGAMA
jgi:hypothetical protein